MKLCGNDTKGRTVNMIIHHSFNQRRADSYIGKSILVGLHIYEQGEASPEQQQVHGVIIQASPAGIKVALKGLHEGGVLNMPPLLDEIGVAGPGTYLLGDERVEDPHFVASWAIYRALKH